MENWWLSYCKCLLIGDLKFVDDINILDKIASAVVKLVKRLKGSVTAEQDRKIRLLLTSFGQLSRPLLIRDFAKFLNLLARSSIIRDILKYLNTVENDLIKLTRAARNPVILVLDRVRLQKYLDFALCFKLIDLCSLVDYRSSSSFPGKA